MLDFGHFPTGAGDLQVFTSPITVDNKQWLTWRKPRACNMAYMFMLGGGGGGGGGFTAAAAAARGGGGGGGSGGQSTLLIPLFLLPDILYIQVGGGGVGVGSGGGTAGNGVTSLISVAASNTANNILLKDSNNGAVSGAGGVTGTGAAVGSGGGSVSPSAIGVMPLAGLGFWQSFAGQQGTAGGAVAGGNGTAISLPISGLMTTGGTGGGGTTSADFQAGVFTSVAGALVSEQRPFGGPSGTFNGCGGPIIWKPFFNFGGVGGGSSNTLAGGNGGIGAYGAGGGGGGGGTTGGTGGNGGNGIVIIYSW